MHASERLLGEAAELRGHVLVEEEDRLPMLEQLVRGDQPRESRARDDDVRLKEVLGHRLRPLCRGKIVGILAARPPGLCGPRRRRLR